MTKQFKNSVFRLGIIIFTVIFFTACVNTIDEKANKNQKENNLKKAVEEMESPISDISFKDEKGKIVSLSSLRGKAVFINFWATWCPPCVREMPSINKLKESFKGNENIIFLMVDVDNNVERSSAFMKNNSYDLPVYVPMSEIPASFLGRSIPTTVLLDKSGDMIARIEGGRDYQSPEMIKILNELMESN